MKKLMMATILVFLGGVVFADGTYEGSWAGLSGTVAIPSGVVAPIADGDLADFAKVTALVFEDSTSGVSATSLTGELILNAACSGAGTFTVSNCAGGFTINSDNSALTGHFAVTQTRVSVSCRYGLGGPNTAAAVFNQGTTSTYGNYPVTFTGTGDALKLEVPVETAGAIKIGADPATNELRLEQNASILHTVSSSPSEIKARIYLTSQTRVSDGSKIGAKSNAHTWIYADKEVFYEAGSKIKCGPSSGAYIQGTGLVHLCGESIMSGAGFRVYNVTPVICEADNVFGTAAYAPGASYSSSGYLDLNGHSVEISDFNTSYPGAAADKLIGCRIQGETGGLLKQTGGNGVSNNPIFTGKTSYEFAASGKSHTFSTSSSSTKSRSSSVGSLTVSAGTLTLANGWGWGGTNVTVNGSAASLVCNSPYSITSEDGIGETGDIEKATRLVVADGGSLTIGSGVTLTVRSVKIGAVTLPGGQLLSVAEINDTYGDQFDGCTLGGEGSIYTLVDSAWRGWVGPSVAVPDGMEVSMFDSDIAAVNAMSSIAIGAGAKITVVTTNETLTLAAKVSGLGDFTFVSCAPVVLAGDSSSLMSPGHYDFKATTVTVRSPTALGGPDTGTAIFRSTVTTDTTTGVPRLLFGNGGAAVTNEVPIKLDGTCIVGAETTDDVFVQAVDFRTVGTSAVLQYLRFLNEVHFIAGTFGGTSSRRFTLKRTGTSDAAFGPHFEESCVISQSGSMLLYGQDYFFGCEEAKLTFQPNFAAAVKMTMTRADVFTKNTSFLSYVGGIGFLDLNGFDQTIWVWSHYEQPTSTTSPTQVKSSTPAILSFVASGTTDRGKLALRFRGEAGVNFATTNSYTLCCGLSDTKGPLMVGAGKVAFAWNAGWNVATNIMINGGTLEITETAATTPLSRDAEIAMISGSKLLLSDGRNVTVRRCSVGGDYLKPGTYGGSAAQAAGLVDEDHVRNDIFGTDLTGTLTVRKGDPGRGIFLLVR